MPLIGDLTTIVVTPPIGVVVVTGTGNNLLFPVLWTFTAKPLL